MTTNQSIVPHLWFDKEAKEAAGFYASVFPESKVKSVRQLRDTPSDDADLVYFQVMGQQFAAISAGPYFKFNPSISFLVNFDPSQDENVSEKIDEIWNKLLEGGTPLMPLDKYPYSEKYGWIQDKYGVSWQLMLKNPGDEERPRIVPSLLFVNEQCGRAEEAIDFYLSLFKSSRLGQLARYSKGMEPDKEGTIMFADFMLENQWFAAMDSAHKHKFDFNEAVSFLVNCDTQEEIDKYWEQLSAFPKAEQCGWVKDKFGVSWQIVPRAMDEMMIYGSQEQIDRVNKEMLKMKKLNIAELESAYNEN